MEQVSGLCGLHDTMTTIAIDAQSVFLVQSKRSSEAADEKRRNPGLFPEVGMAIINTTSD